MTVARIEHKKDSLLEIWSEVWAFRELLYQFTLRDIRVRYKQAVMGFAWALFLLDEHAEAEAMLLDVLELERSNLWSLRRNWILCIF